MNKSPYWEDDLDPATRKFVMAYEKERGYFRNLNEVAVAAIMDLIELGHIGNGVMPDSL